ncbi:hypothetical protein THICB3320146 [Thiomonas sp. CB3]|nr:hypothetical protein THICB3320146 [Thiomonas sp. CB3]
MNWGGNHEQIRHDLPRGILDPARPVQPRVQGRCACRAAIPAGRVGARALPVPTGHGAGDAPITSCGRTIEAEYPEKYGGYSDIMLNVVMNRFAQRSVLNERAKTLGEITNRASSGLPNGSQSPQRGIRQTALVRHSGILDAGREAKEPQGIRGQVEGRPGSGTRSRETSSLGQGGSGVTPDLFGGVDVNPQPDPASAQGQGALDFSQPAEQRETAPVRKRPGRAGQQPSRTDEHGGRAAPGLEQAGPDGAGQAAQGGPRAKPGDRAARPAGVPAGRDIPAKSGLNYRFTPERVIRYIDPVQIGEAVTGRLNPENANPAFKGRDLVSAKGAINASGHDTLATPSPISDKLSVPAFGTPRAGHKDGTCKTNASARAPWTSNPRHPRRRAKRAHCQRSAVRVPLFLAVSFRVR